MKESKKTITIVYYREDLKKWAYKLTYGELFKQGEEWFTKNGFTISGTTRTQAGAFRLARMHAGVDKVYNLLIWLIDKYRKPK